MGSEHGLDLDEHSQVDEHGLDVDEDIDKFYWVDITELNKYYNHIQVQLPMSVFDSLSVGENATVVEMQVRISKRNA